MTMRKWTGTTEEMMRGGKMTREEAIKRLMAESCKSRLYCELYPDACMKEECEIYMAIEALKERPKGHWETYKDEHLCSVCKGYATGEWYYEDDAYDYCPWCGAEMTGED